MRRAEDAALTVYNEHPWARLASRISVDCATRGGRGGLTPKVATREFLPSVFAARQAPVLADDAATLEETWHRENRSRTTDH